MSDEVTLHPVAAAAVPDPAPAPSPDILDGIEEQIDALLANDPAKIERLHAFFEKLAKARPILDRVLKLLAVFR